MEKINVIFMGTPEFALPILQELIDNVSILLVVTQPDKKVGRKQEVIFSPIKNLALKHNIEVFQPTSIKEDFLPVTDKNADLIVTCAYGQIVPKEILANPRLGCINVHASLLPKLRGGAPIHKALIEGYSKTGVTLIYMDSKMDSGDIIATKEYKIKAADNVGTLHNELSLLGSQLLKEELPKIVSGTNNRTKQNESEVTYAYNIKREEEILDFNEKSINIFNKVRGLNPWPLSHLLLDNEEIKVIECTYELKSHNEEPSVIIDVNKNQLGISSLDGIIYLTKIKPFGKKEMNIKDYLNGKKQEDLIGKRVN